MREMVIKAIMTNHFTPPKMAIITNIESSKCWQGGEEIEDFIRCWRECKMGQLLWKRVWQFLKKLNVESPYDPAISLLQSHPRELKTRVQTKTCTWLFTAALFTIVKGWGRLQWPSSDERIDRMGSICSAEYRSAAKRKDVLIHATSRKTLKNIMLSERRQTQRPHIVWFHL